MIIAERAYPKKYPAVKPNAAIDSIVAGAGPVRR
jgi:hypothetical protein